MASGDFAIKTFHDLNLSHGLLEAIAAFGWKEPTPIQQQVIPVAIGGGDILGSAQTGTGKTAAFVFPMIERLHGKHGIHGLVLCPTREIALQTQSYFDHFGKKRGVTALTIIGGASMKRQHDELKRKPSVLIATPGRLADHLRQKSIHLNGISILVLDEADRMLDMGFWPQIKNIMHQLPKEKQTMLFSATLPRTVTQLIHDHLKNPVHIHVAGAGKAAERADQSFYVIDMGQKRAALLKLLQTIPGSTLIFTRTKRNADIITKFLKHEGLTAACMHSDFSQRERLRALHGFKNGHHRILVATDIAARGIDVDNIAHVINFNIPQSPDDYIHRIGRTARATKTGHASTLASAEDFLELAAIDKHLGTPVPRKALEGIPQVATPTPQHRSKHLKPMGKRRSRIRSRW